MRHQGRVVATGARNYATRFCDGTLTVEPDRLVVQGAPHRNGRDRTPIVTEHAEVTALHLTCGLFGATLKRETSAGYRSPVIRVHDPNALLADLRAHDWPTELSGLRRPRG